MPVPARHRRRGSAMLRSLGAVAGCLFALALFSCNRDFSSPVDARTDGKDTVKAADTRKPDSVTAEDLTLTAGGEPVAPKVAWHPSDFSDKRYRLISDNAPVAQVDGDKIRPVSAGTAQVTLITEAGRLVASFQVTVKAKAKPPDPDKTIHVASVTANPLSLLVGEEARAVLAWNPADATDKSFTLSTQNGDKVEIRGDKVAAKAAGTAHVLVTARDGGKTATFTVTVTEKDTRIRVQSLAAADLGLAVGQEADPVLTWVPGDATDKSFKLISADPAVVSAAGNRVRAEAPGTAIVLVQSLENAGKSAAFKVTVTKPARGVTASDMAFTLDDPPRAPSVAWDPPDASDRRYRLSADGSGAVKILQDTLVQPAAPGTAHVTLTALGGDFRHEFQVTVAARVIPVLSVGAQNLTLKAGGPEAEPLLTWNPPDATDKGFALSAAASDNPPAAVAGNRILPLRAGDIVFTVTPSGGGSPAIFRVTVLSRLDRLAAADTLIAEDARDLAPALTWEPADIEDKTYSLTSDGPAVSVSGALFSAAAIGEARLTVTAQDGGRQADFRVTVVERRCLDYLQDKEKSPEAAQHRKCCRDTGRLCLVLDPPIDTLPVDTLPVDTLPLNGP